MAVGAVREGATPMRLGGVPRISLAVSPDRPGSRVQAGLALQSAVPGFPGRPAADAFASSRRIESLALPDRSPSPARSAGSRPSGSSAKPAESGLLEKAWVGTLGVGAGGFGYFLSRTMMNFARDLGPFTLKNAFKGQFLGGAVAGLPFTVIGDSFGYKKGEVSARRYWGNVVSGTVSFGLWGVGAMAATALVPVGGVLGVAAGLAAGGLFSSLFDKTIGREISDAVASRLPAEGARKAADAVVRFVTNPIEKAIVEPVKRNWKLFLATGGAAGIYFGARGGQGKEALKGIGAMAVSAVPQMFGDAALSARFPMKPLAGVDAVPGANQVFSPEDGRIAEKEADE